MYKNCLRNKKTIACISAKCYARKNDKLQRGRESDDRFKKVILPVLLVVLFLAGCNQAEVPALVLDGTITDTSLLENNNELTVNGTLTWNGEKNDYASEVMITVSSNTAVTNATTGKAMKLADIKEEDTVRAVFPQGSNITSPAPGKVSENATSLKVTPK